MDKMLIRLIEDYGDCLYGAGRYKESDLGVKYAKSAESIMDEIKKRLEGKQIVHDVLKSHVGGKDKS